MSETLIIPFHEKYRAQVEDIFFESSIKKVFISNEERRLFRWKYLDYYLLEHPEFAFIATSSEKVLGYVVGTPKILPELLHIQPHLCAFSTYFESFPAHLHVNCREASRGSGVGSRLVAVLESVFLEASATGVHVMTGADSKNYSFYTRLGYLFERKHSFNGNEILFLGKKLTSIVRKV